MNHLEKLRKLRSEIINGTISDKDAIDILLGFTETFNKEIDLEELAFVTELLRFKKLNKNVKAFEKLIESKKKENLELLEFIFLSEDQLQKRKEELRILINRQDAL